MSHLDEGTLTALLDGEIPSEELAPISAHLSECPACRALMTEVRALAGEADTLVTSLGDGAPATEVLRPVAPLRAAPRTGRYRQWAWAATVIMAAGLGYWSRDPGGMPVASRTVSTLEAPALAAREDQNAVEPSPQASRTGDPDAEVPAARRQIAEGSTPAVPEALVAAPAAPRPAERLPETIGGISGRGAPEAAKAADARATRQDNVASGAAARDLGLRAAPSTLSTPGLAPAALERQEVAVESFAPIGFVEAIAQMGGTLRLIDGLVPDRLEASPTTVRVIYPLATGELILEQRRLGDSIEVALRGPVSPDSLAVLRRRVR